MSLKTKLNLISYFDTAEWTKTAGTGTISEDTTNYIKSKALKITTSTDTAETTIQKNISPVLDYDANFAILILYIDDVTKLNLLHFIIFTNSSTSKYYEKFANRFNLKTGWNIIVIRKQDLTPQGGATSWDGINRIKVGASSLSGQTVNVTFTALYFTKNLSSKGQVLLTHDDSNSTDYTIAKPKLDSCNLRGNFFTIINNIGAQSYYTTQPQLDEMYEVGHDICSHTISHPTLTSLDAPTLQHELVGSYKQLMDWGFVRSADILAPPGGIVNDVVLSEIKKTYALTRSYAATYQNKSGESSPLINNHFMKVGICGRDYLTLANAKAYVDKMVTQKFPGILTFHKLETTASTPDNWATSDYNELMDYIKTYIDMDTLENITLSELKNLIWKPIIKGKMLKQFNKLKYNDFTKIVSIY